MQEVEQTNKDIEATSRKRIEELTVELLKEMGYSSIEDNPDMRETPRRFAGYMRSFAANRQKEELRFTVFPANKGMTVTVDNLEVRSLCAHHLAPFVGGCTITYITGDTKAGLSKFQRVVDYFASKPQDQETLTETICDFLISELQPETLMVEMTCQHTCMSVRGVKNSRSMTHTRIAKAMTPQGTYEAY